MPSSRQSARTCWLSAWRLAGSRPALASSSNSNSGDAARAGDLDASAVTAVEFTHLAAAPFAELLALQLEFDAFIRQGPRHAVQGGVVAQVLLDGQVQVQRALLEHHAEAGERWRGASRRPKPAMRICPVAGRTGA